MLLLVRDFSKKEYQKLNFSVMVHVDSLQPQGSSHIRTFVLTSGRHWKETKISIFEFFCF